MFAVIKTGGKQYSVQPDDVIRVEKLAGEPGDMIEIGEVLMIGNEVGAPLIDGAMVTAEIVDQSRARKVIAFKKRRRQNSRRKIGHRQHYTELLISEILGKGEKATKSSTGAGAKKASGRSVVARSSAKASSNDASSDTPSKDDGAGSAGEGSAGVGKGDESPSHQPGGDDAPAPAPVPTENGARKSLADLDGPLFTAPEGEADKLTDIKGIGPVAERQLKEQGITTFRQIAELDADDIQRVDDYMPFSTAQIQTWQAQAKEKIA